MTETLPNEDPDFNAFIVELGERLTSIRVAAGLTVDAVAQRAGLTHRTVAFTEAATRNPTISTLRRLAKALDVKLHDIIPAEDPRYTLAESTIQSLEARFAKLLAMRGELTKLVAFRPDVLETIGLLDRATHVMAEIEQIKTPKAPRVTPKPQKTAKPKKPV